MTHERPTPRQPPQAAPTERVRQLRSGETLFELGETGETVYVIVEGELEIIADTVEGDGVTVARLGPDDVVGEIGAVFGGRRTATVRATTASRVREFDAASFTEWLDDNPTRAAEIATEARSRIDRTRVVRAIADLVGVDKTDLIDRMAGLVEPVSIDAGTVLFHQGDAADAAYILTGGQMRATAVHEGQQSLDVRIGRGELIGEMGIIEQLPRNATVRAIRDCTLARIPKHAMQELTGERPDIMLPIVRRIVTRVSRPRRGRSKTSTIAITVTAPGTGSELIDTIVDEIGRHGDQLHLDAGRVAAHLNRPNIANATAGTPGDERVTELLYESDVAHRWVILECDGPESNWSRRVLRTSDRVVILASAQPSGPERDAIRAVRAVLDQIGDFDLWLGQVNPNTLAHPQASASLRTLAGASRVLHLKRDDERSVRRLARLMSGNGLGVAFSGGGARSYGQIGAVKAMQELGICIDAVAGTSMGSVIGAFIALVDDTERSLEAAAREFTGAKFLDYTLPFASIFSAESLNERIAGVFGGLDVQDTMIPFMCLSTNLSKARLVEHREGDLAHALRASVSLPGVFPPVPMGEDLLVDGGVLENLPVRPLRDDPGISKVIALDVTPPSGPSAPDGLGLSLSGLDILRRRLGRRRFRYPPLAHTVIASMLVGSAQARMTALDNDVIDLYVSLNLSQVKLLDFDRLAPAVERGYTDALPILRDWLDH